MSSFGLGRRVNLEGIKKVKVKGIMKNIYYRLFTHFSKESAYFADLSKFHRLNIHMVLTSANIRYCKMYYLVFNIMYLVFMASTSLRQVLLFRLKYPNYY